MNKKILSKIPTLQNTDVAHKRCLVRVDFNVPIKNKKIVNPSRILTVKPTIDYLLKAKAKIILLSHLSRIKSYDDIKSGKKSLKIVLQELRKMFPHSKITFIADNTKKTLPSIVKKMSDGQIILLENTRYQDIDVKTKQLVKRESGNSPKLAKFWASLGEVFVNDAFATIHRKHASNAGIASHIKSKCVGFLIQNELENIIKFNNESPRPIVSIVGGSKINDKISLIEKLLEMSDKVLIGGAMANTFLTACGIKLGKSFIEKDMVPTAKKLYEKYKNKILLPIDLNVCNTFDDKKGKNVSIGNFPQDAMALDIGKKTIKQFKKVIKLAKTIFWNGTTGVGEFTNYSHSTLAFSKAIADSTANGAFSLIGGGDTVAAATKYVKSSSFSYISTGGGATLAVIADDDLPGLFLK